MNKINCIYTTISGGKVHIAADTKYIGSVDCYNNYFTQFFAWASGLSIAVDFDGEVRSLNKESYTNLIRSLTQNSEINDICQCSIFRPVAEASRFPKSNLKMRDVITFNDRQTLFQKLAIAISRGDTANALLMIGKGAELDTIYYDRDQLNPSFSSDSEGLDSDSRYDFTVFKASPILQAARKGNVVVCEFLKDAGANLEAIGKQYTFTRVITNVDRRLKVALEPRFVHHHHYTKDSNGRYHDNVSRKLKYVPALREHTIVTTQDSRSSEQNYQLERFSFNLRRV